MLHKTMMFIKIKDAIRLCMGLINLLICFHIHIKNCNLCDSDFILGGGVNIIIRQSYIDQQSDAFNLLIGSS